MTQELVNKLSADAYLTKKEAAEYLGYSTRTIERFMKCGLKYYQMVGGPRFKKADLDAFANQFLRRSAA
jgi:excisionase family DNA binding protein